MFRGVLLLPSGIGITAAIAPLNVNLCANCRSEGFKTADVQRRANAPEAWLKRIGKIA